MLNTTAFTKPRIRQPRMIFILGLIYVAVGFGFLWCAVRPAHAENLDAMYRLGYARATPNERTAILLECIDRFEKQEQEDERHACERKLFADFARNGISDSIFNKR
jgi:hypothetical protein